MGYVVRQAFCLLWGGWCLFILYLTVYIIRQMQNKSLCFKVILIGNCKVGKTSLLNYIVGKNIRQKIPTPTIGVQYSPVNIRIGANNVRVNVWDTSGAEQYKSITRSYYRKCHGVLIMFDITDKKTFEDLKVWLHQIKTELKTSKTPTIIIANKYDLVENGTKTRGISQKEMVDFCVEHNLQMRETSAKTGLNVRQTFNQFIKQIYEQKNYEQENSEKMMYVNSISLDKQKSKSIEPEAGNCSKCC